MKASPCRRPARVDGRGRVRPTPWCRATAVARACEIYGASIRAMPAAVLLLCVAVSGCEVGEPGPARVVAGPSVPSPIPTEPPYVWDTRAALDIWATNAVSHGPIALDGTGADAFVRIDPASSDWVLRGPDLQPPATAVRAIRLRYRWTPDASLPPAIGRTPQLTAYVDRSPPHFHQPMVYALLQATPDWTTIDLTVPERLDIRYVYFRSSGWSRGVFEIDAIQLVQ